MSNTLFSLDTIRVASPCRAAWDDMEGDDRARFCGLCQRTVYNLSGMSRTEAEALVLEEEGRLCVRFYRRIDGTLLTRDCPIGARIWRRRLIGGCLAGMALVAAMAFWGFSMLVAPGAGADDGLNVFQRVWLALFPGQGRALAPIPGLPPGHPDLAMGAICLPEVPPIAPVRVMPPEGQPE